MNVVLLHTKKVQYIFLQNVKQQFVNQIQRLVVPLPDTVALRPQICVVYLLTVFVGDLQSYYCFGF